MHADGSAAPQRPDVPALRPLSLTEMLEVAIRLCLAQVATLLKVVLIVVVPVQAVATGVLVATGAADFDVFASAVSDDMTTTQTNTYLVGQLVAAGLQALAVVLVAAACFHALVRERLGCRTHWRATLRFAAARGARIAWIVILYLGALVGAACVATVASAIASSSGVLVLVLFASAFLVLCAWLFVAWSFALPALLAEDAGGAHALRRSAELVKGRWWPTCAVIVVGLLVALVVTAVVQTAFALIFLAGVDRSSLAALLIVSAAALVALIVTAPFQAALLAVIYLDLRVRRRSLGLEQLAERLGVLPAPGSAAVRWPAADDAADAGASQQPDVGAPYWPAPGARGSRPHAGDAAADPDPGPPPRGWRPPA